MRFITCHKVRCPLQGARGVLWMKALTKHLRIRSYLIFPLNILVQGLILVDYLDHPKITHHLCPFGCVIDTSMTKPISTMENPWYVLICAIPMIIFWKYIISSSRDLFWDLTCACIMQGCFVSCLIVWRLLHVSHLDFEHQTCYAINHC